MKKSTQSVYVRGMNEGHPPTTREWNEFEAKQSDGLEERRAGGKPRTRRPPPKVPELTPEQIAHYATQIHSAVVLLVEALDRELWDARWTNRLMHAHTIAHSMLTHAAAWQPPQEAIAASDSATVPTESDAAAGVGNHRSRGPTLPG